MSKNSTIKVTKKNGIGRITFFNPKSNSLTGDLLRKLANTIKDAGKDEEIKVVILQSEGDKAFCAGASFDELLAIDNFETGKKFFMGFAMVINAMRKCPKFIIARVQSKAVGGGVGLISASDYALGVDNASVKLSELALGIGPFVVGPAVERKIGRSAFSTMSIDTNWYDAEWAKDNGLYVDVYNTINDLDTAVNKLAAKLSQFSPEAMKELKEVLWQGTEHWDELLEKRTEKSGRLVLSDFTSKAIEKFKQK